LKSIFEVFIKSSFSDTKRFLVILFYTLTDTCGQSALVSQTEKAKTELEDLGIENDDIKNEFFSSFTLLPQKPQKELLTQLLSSNLALNKDTESLLCEMINKIEQPSIDPDSHTDTNLLQAISYFGSKKVLNAVISACNLNINLLSIYELTNESCFFFLSHEQKTHVSDDYLEYIDALTDHPVDIEDKSNRDALKELSSTLSYATILNKKGICLEDIFASN